MKGRRFREGERVRIRRTIAQGLALGTAGTIERVYVAAPGMYDVQFDGCRDIRMVWCDDLERVEQEVGRMEVNSHNW